MSDLSESWWSFGGWPPSPNGECPDCGCEAHDLRARIDEIRKLIDSATENGDVFDGDWLGPAVKEILDRDVQ